jgi:hypothetical protein
MNRGLIITHTRTMANRLLVFTAYIKHDGAETPLAPVICRNAEELLTQYIDLKFFGITYLSGPAATKSLAKKFGLKYRKRAPGAGRPKLTIEAKAKQVTIWLTDPQKVTFQAAARKLDLAEGPAVYQMSLNTLKET